MKAYNHNERDEFRFRRGEDRHPRRPEPRELTEMERNALPALVLRCGHFVAHYTDGARGQGRIMRILAERREMSQRQLQDEVGVKAGSLSEVLQRLEERGFITRRADEEDRRRVVIAVTEAGLAEADRHNPEGENELFSALTPEEQETLRGLLMRLDESWAAQRETMRGDRRPHRGGERDGEHRAHGEHRHGEGRENGEEHEGGRRFRRRDGETD